MIVIPCAVARPAPGCGVEPANMFATIGAVRSRQAEARAIGALCLSAAGGGTAQEPALVVGVAILAGLDLAADVPTRSRVGDAAFVGEGG